jgi:predicted enzyme related to lactoylglutathione lyase
MSTYAELQEQAKAVESMHGDFCHIELPVTDRERAKAFYGEVFGWSFQDVPEMGYTLFITPSGKLGGGMFVPDDQMPNKVINYINVDSIDATVPKIEAKGGKVLGPKVEIPGHGTMQHLLDSEGTLIALWQGK